MDESNLRSCLNFKKHLNYEWLFFFFAWDGLNQDTFCHFVFENTERFMFLSSDLKIISIHQSVQLHSVIIVATVCVLLSVGRS